MYPLATYRHRRSRIRWKRDETSETLASFGVGGGGGSGGYGTEPVASGSVITLEDWNYADVTERNTAWPASVDCVCGGGYAGAGGTSGGVGGAAFVQDVYFCCGLGAGAGHAVHGHTFGAADGLLPNSQYRIWATFTHDPDTAFQVAGFIFNSADRTLGGAGSHLVSAIVGTDASAEIAVSLGQFVAEWGLGTYADPVINTFGGIYVELVSGSGGGGGGGTGGGPGGSGMDGAGYCNLWLAFPLVRPVGRARPGNDSERLERSHLRDGIISQYDNVLDGYDLFIPTVTGLVKDQDIAATGWDDPCGWQAFLAHAYEGGEFEFYPDGTVANGHASMRTCVLESPEGGEAQPTALRGRALQLRLRDVAGATFGGW